MFHVDLNSDFVVLICWFLCYLLYMTCAVLYKATGA